MSIVEEPQRMSVHDDPRRERDADPRAQRDPRRTGVGATAARGAEARRESGRPKTPIPVSETRAARVARDPRRDSTRPKLDREAVPARPAEDSAPPRRSSLKDALRERLDARAGGASNDPGRSSEVFAPRHRSQTGTPRGQRAAVYCEIDGLAVEIDPADLSTAGLFIQSPAPPALDSEVRVSIAIGAVRIEAVGHVVKSVSLDVAKKERRRPGFALLWTRLDDRSRNALRDALEGAPIPAESPSATESPSEPEPAPPSATEPKELELLAKLRSELATLEQQPPWTVLGISQSADLTAARDAFFAASKRYHPHQYARYAHPEIKAVVTQLFIAYKRAFTTMTKTGRSARGGAATRSARSGNPPGRSTDPGNR